MTADRTTAPTPHANVIDRRNAPPEVFEAALAGWEAREADPDGCVEKVARAIGHVAYNGFPWDEMDEFERDEYRAQALAAIAALRGPATDDPATAVERERTQIQQGICPRSGVERHASHQVAGFLAGFAG